MAYPKGKKMGEERAAELVVPIALRVQRNHPEGESVALLVAAAATLFMAGYTDPKDRHVLHAARRMRERLAAASEPPPSTAAEIRNLSDAERAELERLAPMWQEIRRRLGPPTVPESTFKIWLEPVVLCGRDGAFLLLGAPPGIRTWVERRYASLFAEAARGTEPKVEGVKFVNWLPQGAEMCESPGAARPQPRTGGQQ